MFTHSEGNPFFVAAYLQAAVAAGLIVRQAGLWETRGVARFDSLGLPTSLRDLLRGRLAALSPQIRDVLEAAAVIGREFDEALLVSVAAVTEAGAMEAMTDALERGLVEVSETGGLRFVHDKIRETAYAELSAERKGNLHRRGGEAIEQRGPGAEPLGAYLLTLAHHFRCAGVSERLLDILVKAGDQALATSSFQSAAALMREACALPPVDAMPAAARAQLERITGEALLSVGQNEASRLHLTKALALHGEPVPGQTPRVVAGLLWEVASQIRRRLRKSSPAVGVAALRSNDLEKVRSYAQLQVALRSSADVPRILYTAVRALNVAERVQAQDAMASGFALMQALSASMPWAGAARRYRDLAHVALERAGNDPVGRMWVRQMDAVCELGEGQLAAGEASATEVVTSARQLGVVLRQRESLVLVGYTRLCAGLLGPALEAYQELIQLGQDGSPRYQNWGVAGAVQVHLRRGDLAAARGLLDQLEPVRGQLQEATDHIALLATEAMVLLREGRLDEALAQAQGGLRLLKSISPAMMEATFPSQELLEVFVGLCVRQGFPKARAAELREATSRLGKIAARQAVIRPDFLLGQGVCAAGAGKKKEAVRLVGQAGDEARRLGMPIAEVRALRALRHVQGGGLDHAAIESGQRLGLAEDPWFLF